MATDKIQANYDQLGEISRILESSRETVETLLRKVISAKDSMMAGSAGDWADDFETEMTQLILPRTQRLTDTLGEAAQVVAKISSTVSEAEDNASACFR